MARRKRLSETPEEEHRRKTVEAYRDCFTTEAGKSVLRDMARSYHNNTTFTGDPYQSAFNEGRRSVYLDILHLVEAANERTDDNDSSRTAVTEPEWQPEPDYFPNGD
jgi:hypothetical protein